MQLGINIWGCLGLRIYIIYYMLLGVYRCSSHTKLIEHIFHALPLKNVIEQNLPKAGFD